MSAADDLARLADLAAVRADAVEAAAYDGTLADWLYWNWYAALPSVRPPEPAPPPFDRLGGALNALVDRVAPWEGDWIVLLLGADGLILAGRGSIQRMASPGRFASVDRPGLPPVPGERVWLAPLISFVDPATGQWAAQSPQMPEAPMRRFYFSVGPAHVGPLAAALAALLHRRSLRFSMKCPGAAAGFDRTDALVLYLAREDADAAEETIVATALATGVPMREGRPALTRALAPGIATADDPGDGRSFGQARCALLAAAIASAPGERRLAEVLTVALVDAGIDPAEPWRQPA